MVTYQLSFIHRFEISSYHWHNPDAVFLLIYWWFSQYHKWKKNWQVVRDDADITSEEEEDNLHLLQNGEFGDIMEDDT